MSINFSDWTRFLPLAVPVVVFLVLAIVSLICQVIQHIRSQSIRFK